MSKGWESKSVEEQQSLAESAKPAQVSGPTLEEAERKRQRQALEMQRERVLSERTSSPHRRSALEAALLEIEEKLTELGWMIHL